MDYYTVEYRQADGWDQGLPQSAVLIHEWKPGHVPYSYIISGPTVPSGGTVSGWTAGTLYLNGPKNLTVRVTNIDTAPALATVTLSIL